MPQSKLGIKNVMHHAVSQYVATAHPWTCSRNIFMCVQML